jgi:hypothetical protein
MDRRAAWLAWSLAALSLALLVGGIALSRAASSTAPDLQFGGETDYSSAVIDLVTLLTRRRCNRSTSHCGCVPTRSPRAGSPTSSLRRSMGRI